MARISEASTVEMMFTWTHSDPRGVDAAAYDAIARAESGLWQQDAIAQSAGTREADALALLVNSLLLRELMLTPGTGGQSQIQKLSALVGGIIPLNVQVGAAIDADHRRAAVAMFATWEALARRMGWRYGGHAQQLGAQTGSPSGRSGANVIEIVAIVVGIAAAAAIIAFVVYNVRILIDHQLARNAEAQELIRAHADAEKMLHDHAAAEAEAGHAIDFTDDERKVLDRLEELQNQAMAGYLAAQAADPLAPLVPDATPIVVVALVAVGGYLLWERYLRSEHHGQG